MFAHFVRLRPCSKRQSVTLTDIFVAQTVTIGGQKIKPESDLFLSFTDSDYSKPNSFRLLLPRPGSGISISSKYFGTTRSLATRRTLGIPKSLKCINKAQPEPVRIRSHNKKAQLRIRSHAYENRELRSWSHFIFTRAPQHWLKALAQNFKHHKILRKKADFKQHDKHRDAQPLHNRDAQPFGFFRAHYAFLYELWAPVSSRHFIFCIVSVFQQQIEPSLLPHVFLAVFSL